VTQPQRRPASSTPDPVLITDAARSYEEELRVRKRRYAVMMGMRVPCMVLAAVFYQTPWLAVTLDEVSIVHRGVVPARARPGAPPALLDRADIRDHALDGIEGAVSIVGVKYTTARRLAEQTVDLVAGKLRRRIARSRTSQLPLLAPVRGEEAEVPKALDAGPADRITRVYGATAARVLGLHAEQPELGRPLAEGVAITGAQVLEAVRHEMALTLEDVVVRRTGLGAAGYPGDAVVRACAVLLQQELGWDAERTEQEVAAVHRFYDVRAIESPAEHDRA